jgi:hypothetical protein
MLEITKTSLKSVGFICFFSTVTLCTHYKLFCHCSELSSGIYCRIRQYIPEDNSEHHTSRRENLKSHIFCHSLHTLHYFPTTLCTYPNYNLWIVVTRHKITLKWQVTWSYWLSKILLIRHKSGLQTCSLWKNSLAQGWSVQLYPGPENHLSK